MVIPFSMPLLYIAHSTSDMLHAFLFSLVVSFFEVSSTIATSSVLISSSFSSMLIAYTSLFAIKTSFLDAFLLPGNKLINDRVINVYMITTRAIRGNFIYKKLIKSLKLYINMYIMCNKFFNKVYIALINNNSVILLNFLIVFIFVLILIFLILSHHQSTKFRVVFFTCYNI